MESYTCTGYRGYYTLGCELRGITVCSLWGGVPWGARVLGLMGRGLLGFEVWVRLRLCGWCWSLSPVSSVCRLSVRCRFGLCKEVIIGSGLCVVVGVSVLCRGCAVVLCRLVVNCEGYCN